MRAARILSAFWLMPAILLVFFSCYSTSSRTEARVDESSFYPFSFRTIDATFVDTLFQKVYIYNPPISDPKYKIAGFIYRLDFELNYFEDVSDTTDFIVYIDYPDGSVEEILIDHELLLNAGLPINRYAIDVEVDGLAPIRVTLAWWDEFGEICYDPENPFQSKWVNLR